MLLSILELKACAITSSTSDFWPLASDAGGLSQGQGWRVFFPFFLLRGPGVMFHRTGFLLIKYQQLIYLQK
jgi:hypothetical protein